MKGKTLVIGGVILIVIITIILVIFHYGLFQSLDSSQDNFPGNSYTVGDINQDGTIDAVDENFVMTHEGCKKTDKCWDDVIGKTLSGDNPIYTSDLDLDHNGVIDKEDLNMLKSIGKR